MRTDALLLVFLCAIGLTSSASALSIDDEWIFSVAYIQNRSTDKAGTGFFVARQVQADKGKLFLVSNKHVLFPDLPPGKCTSEG